MVQKWAFTEKVLKQLVNHVEKDKSRTIPNT